MPSIYREGGGVKEDAFRRKGTSKTKTNEYFLSIIFTKLGIRI